MARHVVIGTAGHVDHGKTALVKALTGIDTDRWEEEKRRGITIDLGFAHMDLGDGLRASVVDVPGHEDFVRNMLAGATGIDVALLVVAADEGVMPQTIEHLAILDFLGVTSGVVAITKADLVEKDWLDLVSADVVERLRSSVVRWEPPVTVSSVTGAGLDRLRAVLADSAVRARERASDDLFRLPIDRVFSVAGAGTVVTGTTWSGTVSVGDEVMVLPGPHRARVRSIEVHGAEQPCAEPGRRTALALVGLDRGGGAVARGSVVVADPSWQATTALDVLVTLLPESRPLTQRSPLRFHLGTAEVMARVTPLRPAIPPGARDEPARLRLTAPIVARWGDRGVLRAASPVTTIGGCVVVDPWPVLRPRRPEHATALAVGDPVARVGAFLAAVPTRGPKGISVSDLPVRLGIRPAGSDALIARAAAGGIRRIGDRLVSGGAVEAARHAMLEAIAAFHREHPLEPGMPLEAVRRAVGSDALAQQALAALREEQEIAVELGTARLAAHRPSIPAALASAGEIIRGELAQSGHEGRTPGELSGKVAEPQAVQLLEYFVREGTALRVGRDRYYARARLEELMRKVLGEIARRGQATPAELREPLGLSRKYLIPLLEWLDGQQLTVRVGDARRLGPKEQA